MFAGARSSVLVAICVVVAGGMAGVVAPAAAQDRFPATVTSVVDGDTVDAQVAGGPALRVRLIGIDTPERGECGTDQATAYMEQLALERNVTLVSDPTRDTIDSFGRSVFYIDRDDGLDVGREMVSAGWAEVFVFERDFQRLSSYFAAQANAERFRGGVWSRCGGERPR
jgi:micrococcal nuclease